MKPLGLLFMCNKLCNKSSNKIPSYLTIRNGVYYFCYRFPISITSNKSKILRYSLRTKDLSIARERLADLMPIIKKAKQTQQLLNASDRIESIHVGGLEDTVKMDESERLLKLKRFKFNLIKQLANDIDEYADIYTKRITRYANGTTEDRDIYIDVVSKHDKLSLIEKNNALNEFVQTIIHLIKTEDLQADRELLEFALSFKGIYEFKGEEYVKGILFSILRYRLDYPLQLDAAYIKNDEYAIHAIKHTIDSSYTRLLNEINYEQQSQQARFIQIEHDLSPISHYIPEFLQWEEGGRSRTKEVQQTYSRDLNFLIHVIGDKPINKVAKEDIKEALSFKKCMPVMNKNPYRQWGVEETIQKIKEGYEVEDDADLVSSKTVKETLKCYQSFFSSFLFKEKDLLEKSPTENVTLTYESESYAPYTDTQMVDIVNYCRENPSEKTMVILIGAYTGMRLSEICNLTKESIRYDEESGYNYIFIKKGKTPAACRIVPICNKLKSAGLLEHINNFNIEQKMFSKKTDLITNEIQKIREILHIPHENEFGQRRVFHSIRHSVITKVRSKQISDPVLQKVVGHQTVKSITDRYTHNFPVKDLTCVVDCLDW